MSFHNGRERYSQQIFPVLLGSFTGQQLLPLLLLCQGRTSPRSLCENNYLQIYRFITFLRGSLQLEDHWMYEPSSLASVLFGNRIFIWQRPNMLMQLTRWTMKLSKKKQDCFKIYVWKFTNNMQLSSDYLSMDIWKVCASEIEVNSL